MMWAAALASAVIWVISTLLRGGAAPGWSEWASIVLIWCGVLLISVLGDLVEPSQVFAGCGHE